MPKIKAIFRRLQSSDLVNFGLLPLFISRLTFDMFYFLDNGIDILYSNYSAPDVISSIETIAAILLLIAISSAIGFLFFLISSISKLARERRATITKLKSQETLHKNSTHNESIYSVISSILFIIYIIISILSGQFFNKSYAYPELNAWFITTIILLITSITLMTIHIRIRLRELNRDSSITPVITKEISTD